MSNSSSKVATPAATLTPTTTRKEVPPPAPAEAVIRRRRPRMGLKRVAFQVPQKMPLPVRALWASASLEDQTRAHQTAKAILRTWLGKATREEAAKEIGLSPLRFWQLSQQAVAGLVAGLLKQPRFRRALSAEGPVEESVGVLRKRIATLERELDGAKRLIGLLKELPALRPAPPAPAAESGDGDRRSARSRGKVPVEALGGAAPDLREGSRDVMR